MDPARWTVLFALLATCAKPDEGDAPRAPARSATALVAPVPSLPSTRAFGPSRFALVNRFAYIPPQCYTKTRDELGRVSNPCYACHLRSEPPSYVNDADLQLTLSLPAAAARNPWTNLFDPPASRAASMADDDVLAYVRRSNYFDDRQERTLTLARALDDLPNEDGTGHREWSGFRPDAWYSFDDRGFDHRPDGSYTGWRAFAYYPFLGTFFPTNGSMDDVLIRLDPRLQEDAEGRFDARVYEINLAVVEALVTRREVPVDRVSELELGVDLDRDGTLAQATHVAFGKDMRFVGRASREAPSAFPIGPGLFPLNTEFLHSVRYLDVQADGAVAMAARMKELRYAKKIRWLSDSELQRKVAAETVEQSEAPDGVSYFVPQGDRGVYNGLGWLFQGFIEGERGTLRPQSYEETVACVGCHGGIGATTDSIFSLARKVRASRAPHGWVHWTQQGLAGLAEPRRQDGRYEYTLYLEANRGGDDLRENTEVLERFFDAKGHLRAEPVARLHRDIGTLLLPSAARAIDLDRAYLAIVREQSYVRGRDAVLGPASHVYATSPVGERTGIGRAIDGP